MKRLRIFLTFILLILICPGCGKDVIDEKTDDKYNVFYLDADGITLVTEKYESNNTNVSKLAQELLDKLYTPEKEEHLTVFKKNFTVDRISIDEQVIYVYMSESYYDMNDVEEVLVRSALVKTFCQIDGVEYVSFYINEQPFVNDSGNVVGLMSANDYIDDTDESLNSLQWAEMSLYYSDASGQNLVCEQKKVAYSGNISIERAVIENLIDEPDSKDAKSALPKNLKLLGVSTKDGICYVNFDAVFLTAMVDVSADVTVYSIVNSLCEIDNIKQVQILVNGSFEETFMDKYPLTTLFERNLNLVTDVYVVPTVE